jgi:Flp pilus assembly protein TadB
VAVVVAVHRACGVAAGPPAAARGRESAAGVVKGQGPNGRGRTVHDNATRFLSALMIVLGVLLVARGALLGVIIGVAMIAAGVGRMWVVSQQRSRR